MIETKFILTDVDGVLLNWGQGFETWLMNNYQNYGLTKPEVSLEDSMNIELWLGLTHAETRPLVKDFNNSSEAFKALRPFDDALHYLTFLKRDGYDFIAITACSSNQDVQDARRENLETVFPGIFDTIHCVDVDASKHRFLSRYKPTWWIEDKPEHAEDGAQLGHMSFLINRKYNQGFKTKHSKRVYGWKDIYECITNDGCTYPGWIA